MARYKLILVTGSVLLAGCAATGDEQNYKELEGDKSRPFQTERDPFFSRTTGASAPPVQLANLEDESVTNTTVSTEQEAEAVKPTEPQHSVTGLDRSHSTPVTFDAADGTTFHQPTYYGRVERRDDGLSVLLPHRFEWRMAEALAANRAGKLNRENLIDLVVLPLRTVGSTLLLPVSMVVKPPWSTETTP